MYTMYVIQCMSYELQNASNDSVLCMGRALGDASQGHSPLSNAASAKC